MEMLHFVYRAFGLSLDRCKLLHGYGHDVRLYYLENGLAVLIALKG